MPEPGQTAVEDWMKKEIENVLSVYGAHISMGETN